VQSFRGICRRDCWETVDNQTPDVRALISACALMVLLIQDDFPSRLIAPVLQPSLICDY